MTTREKEATGEYYLDHYKVWDRLFPTCDIEKVTDKDRQLSGIDFVVHNADHHLNIDLKVCISSNDRDYDGLPIEISQATKATNGRFKQTNTKDKATDALLYVVQDKKSRHLYAYLLDYAKICDWCTEIFFGRLDIEQHLSFNKSGKYVLYQPKWKDPFVICSIRLY